MLLFSWIIARDGAELSGSHVVEAHSSQRGWPQVVFINVFCTIIGLPTSREHFLYRAQSIFSSLCVARGAAVSIRSESEPKVQLVERVDILFIGCIFCTFSPTEPYRTKMASYLMVFVFVQTGTSNAVPGIGRSNMK